MQGLSTNGTDQGDKISSKGKNYIQKKE